MRIYLIKFLVLLCGGCLLAVFSSSAWARVSVEPHLLLRAEYDDNVFLDPSDEQDDLITVAAPGLRLGFDSNYLNADLDYSLEFRFYRDNTAEDETSLRDTQRALAHATVLPGRDFTVDFTDEYSRVVIDERRPVSEANAFVNKTNRNLFVFNPRYRLRRFKTFEAGLGYTYRNLYYDAEAGDDSQSHRLDADVLKKISSRLSLTARYGIELFNAEDADDYQRQDALAGFQALLSSRLKIGGEGGFGWIDLRDDDRTTSALWNVWLQYQLSQRLQLGLDYARDFADSVNEGLVKNQSASAALTYKTDPATSTLRVFAQEAKYQEIDRQDRSAGVSLTAGIPLGKRFDLGLSGYVTYYDFLPEEEDVIRWGAGPSLGYRFRIATFRLGYNYEESDSDIDRNDYRSNIFFAQVSSQF